MRHIEGLEDRRLMAAYLVTGLADGPGVVRQVFPGAFTATTLRGAINAANANPGYPADRTMIGSRSRPAPSTS